MSPGGPPPRGGRESGWAVVGGGARGTATDFACTTSQCSNSGSTRGCGASNPPSTKWLLERARRWQTSRASGRCPHPNPAPSLPQVRTAAHVRRQGRRGARPNLHMYTLVYRAGGAGAWRTDPVVGGQDVGPVGLKQRGLGRPTAIRRAVRARTRAHSMRFSDLRIMAGIRWRGRHRLPTHKSPNEWDHRGKIPVGREGSGQNHSHIFDQIPLRSLVLGGWAVARALCPCVLACHHRQKFRRRGGPAVGPPPVSKTVPMSSDSTCPRRRHAPMPPPLPPRPPSQQGMKNYVFHMNWLRTGANIGDHCTHVGF